MLVLPQKIRVKWNPNNKRRYVEKGYIFTKMKDEFEIDVLDLPMHSKYLVNVSCDYCGEVIPKQYSDYNDRRSENEDCCVDCAPIKISKAKMKYTLNDIKIEFEKRNFTLLEYEYKGRSASYNFICNNDHKTEITFDALLRGNGCKKCHAQRIGDRTRKSIEEVQNIFIKNNCILLTTEYVNNQQKLDYICECGNPDCKNLKAFLNGTRCDECALRRTREANLKYDIAFVKNIFKENGCILLENEYTNIDTPMRYTCVCERPSKISLYSFLKGTRCKECGIKKRSGENHPNWNPDLTDEEREIGRKTEEYSEWRKKVLRRDNYTCQCCGYKGKNLIAHHKDGWHWCVERRTDVDNGVVLCSTCHDIQYEGSFHNVYGNKYNTEQQFNEWIKNKLIEKELIL